jgi:hypothetical protein
MHLEKIPVDKIEMTKHDPNDRTFRRDFCEQLAVSIAAEGLLVPPLVVPVAGKPGWFSVVDGKHRIYTLVKILKWTEVECCVATNLEGEAIESAMLAANAFTNALTDEQKTKTLIRWYKLHQLHYPTSEGSGSAQKMEAAASGEPAEVGSAPVDGRTLPLTRAAESTPKPFATLLEQVLGVSPATAKKLTRVARNLY